ncbi:MAG: hypothetical protein AB8F95_11785 [Bacteroidia bacterium]
MSLFQRARMMNQRLTLCLAGVLGLFVLISFGCGSQRNLEEKQYQYDPEIFLDQLRLVFVGDTLISIYEYLDDAGHHIKPVTCTKGQLMAFRRQQLMDVEKAVARHFWFPDSTISIAHLIPMFNKLETFSDFLSATHSVRSESDVLFELLLKKASNEELLTMTNAESAEARAYAFWALTKRKTPDLFSVVCAHLSDTVMVLRGSGGCLLYESRVGDFFIEKALKEEYPSLSPYSLYKTRTWLTKAEKRKLDSLVLADTTSKLKYLREVVGGSFFD